MKETQISAKQGMNNAQPLSEKEMHTMMSKKKNRRKRCKSCGKILDAIWFTALMTEEWAWDGIGYRECAAKHSLITDPQENVICPHCEQVVGTGFDFGFGKGYK